MRTGKKKLLPGYELVSNQQNSKYTDLKKKGKFHLLEVIRKSRQRDTASSECKMNKVIRR